MFSSQISTASRIYPTNNFGHHHNVYFLHYGSFVNQGNNYNNYGLHQVQIRNNLAERNLQVVRWHVPQGRVEEDFREKIVRPGLFFTARVVPSSWGKYNAIVGAVVFKIQGTNTYYTLAFEDPFHDYVGKGYKGNIIEGDNPEGAIQSLRDHNPKQTPFGKYYFQEFNGRGKTVFEVNELQKK